MNTNDYQSIRFSEYLKGWNRDMTSWSDYFIRYNASFSGRNWELYLESDFLYLINMTDNTSAKINFEDCKDPTTWVSQQLVLLFRKKIN
jgi:hypothetical protein